MNKSKHGKIMTLLLEYHFVKEGSFREDWTELLLTITILA
jgi:hypothetical protein